MFHPEPTPDESILNSVTEFRLMRAAAVEQEYYQKFFDKQNFRKRNELYIRILRLLDSQKHLLMEFADCDAACYNPNTDYFYHSGFDDCLLFLQILDRIGGRENLIDQFLKSENSNPLLRL